MRRSAPVGADIGSAGTTASTPATSSTSSASAQSASKSVPCKEEVGAKRKHEEVVTASSKQPQKKDETKRICKEDLNLTYLSPLFSPLLSSLSLASLSSSLLTSWAMASRSSSLASGFPASLELREELELRDLMANADEVQSVLNSNKSD